MRNRVVLFLVALISWGALALLYAQQQKGGSLPRDRVDLETETLVGKRLERTETGSNGESIYHYLYRVEARPGAKSFPRYVLDHRYNVTYQTEGFQEGDSIRLRSINRESETDSPIWVYDVIYVGSGMRSVNFGTSGSVLVPLFSVANSEDDPDPSFHCTICNHQYAHQCTDACQCCCSTGNEPCNCSGCQYQTPRCFSCLVGCSCSHCVCSCDGCLTQTPRCLSCPIGCTCAHCRCQCVINIDHPGRCGCMRCKQTPLPCHCECHRDCP